MSTSTSKTAHSAARVALLAGVSAVALTVSVSSASAISNCILSSSNVPGSNTGTIQGESSADTSLACGPNATANVLEGTAVGGGGAGVNPRATANFATAVGRNAQATGTSSLAAGDSSQANGVASVALGGDAPANTGPIANGTSSIAIGGRNDGGAAALANGDGGIAVGGGVGPINGARTSLGSSFGIAVGTGSVAGTQDVAIGFQTNVASVNSVGIGPGVAVGPNSSFSVAVGNQATVGANSTQGVALGNQASVGPNAVQATALGTLSNATGNFATAIGRNTTAAGTSSFAGGDSANAAGTASVAIGGDAPGNTGAQALGTSSIAIGGRNDGGASATARGNGAVAIGSGFGTTAGAQTLANTNFGVAIGTGSVAGNQAVAIGPGATATQANTIAIGNGVSTSNPNQVSIGNTANNYTLAGLSQTGAGIVQADSHGNLTTSNTVSSLNVNGPLTVAPGNTIDAGGNRIQNVGTPIFGTDAANKAYVDRGLNKAYEGTAIALAISQPIIGPNQTFAIRAGWGNYESENAFGLSAAGIIGRDWFWNGSTVALDGGVGFSNNNTVAGKAGITLAFGAASPAVYAPLK